MLLRNHIDIALPRRNASTADISGTKVDLSVMLSCSTEITSEKSMNISGGGLALTRFGSAPVEGIIKIEFELREQQPNSPGQG